MWMIEATYIDHMGSDKSVVNAARVSFAKDSTLYTDSQNEKLIKYLGEHKHISPFGHCFATYHVKAPIFVARQLVKHKFLRWNEVSRRYVDDIPECYEPETLRGRSEDKKQGSEGVLEGYTGYINLSNKQAIDDYVRLIHQGVCPEQARMVLPQSTMTEWYWSGSLDAFADMCNLRCKEDTQYESRIVADQIDKKMSELYPVSWEALRD